MHLDSEIYELERRIARRRHRIAHGARVARHRAFRAIVSPAGLLSAVGLGLLAIFGLVRKKSTAPPRARAGKLAGLASLLASLLASAGFALLRAQFGSPAQMAQLVLSKLKKTQHQPVQSRL